MSEGFLTITSPDRAIKQSTTKNPFSRSNTSKHVMSRFTGTEQFQSRSILSSSSLLFLPTNHLVVNIVINEDRNREEVRSARL